MKRQTYLFLRLAFVAIAGLTLMNFSACDPKTQTSLQLFASKANPTFSDLECKSDMRMVNGEPDYGITTAFKVKNIGEDGLVQITALVSCSEGEWSRVQHLSFDSGETRNLSYFFPEPTLNADNVECRIGLRPKKTEEKK